MFFIKSFNFKRDTIITINRACNWSASFRLRLCRVSGYLTETVITRFHFSAPITHKRLFKILTEKEMCGEWGCLLRVVF